MKLGPQSRPWTRCAALLLAGAALWAPTPGLRAAVSKEQDRAEADAFFSNRTILTLSLEISAEGLASLRKTPREYVRATLRDRGTVLTNVVVHLKGGSGSFQKVSSMTSGAPRSKAATRMPNTLPVGFPCKSC